MPREQSLGTTVGDNTIRIPRRPGGLADDGGVWVTLDGEGRRYKIAKVDIVQQGTGRTAVDVRCENRRFFGSVQFDLDDEQAERIRRFFEDDWPTVPSVDPGDDGAGDSITVDAIRAGLAETARHLTGATSDISAAIRGLRNFGAGISLAARSCAEVARTMRDASRTMERMRRAMNPVALAARQRQPEDTGRLRATAIVRQYNCRSVLALPVPHLSRPGQLVRNSHTGGARAQRYEFWASSWADAQRQWAEGQGGDHPPE